MNNWRPISLGDCGTWLSGGTPANSPDYWNGEIPWISGKSLHNIKVSDSDDKVTELGAKHGTRVVPANTILLLVRGMMLKKRIPVGITTRNVTFNQDVKALIPNSDIEPEFLLNWIIAHETQLLYLVEESSHGTGKLSTDVLHDVEVLLPPLAEQRQIAAILSTWDEAITLTTRLIAALQRRKQAFMQLLLSHKQDLPEGWRWAKLREFLKKRNEWITIDDDQLYRRCTVKLHNLGIFPRDEVLGSQIKTKRQQITTEGDLLVAEIDAKVGGFGIVKAETAGSIVSSHYFLFDIDTSVVRDYLEQYIFAGLLESQVDATGSTNYAAIRPDAVLGFKVALPDYETQKQIADLLVTCDNELSLYENYLQALQTQKRGLMQQLLTGAVRVPLA